MLALQSTSLPAQPAPSDQAPRTGAAAYGDWRTDAPGVLRLLKPDTLQPSGRSVSNTTSVVRQPAGAALKVPPGFAVELFARGLSDPRQMKVAPNGDVFVAESSEGRIRVLRPNPTGTGAERTEVFASGLDYPFGIAFWPPGDDPQWVYVGATNKVVRFPYKTGDFSARGRPETIVPTLPTGGHATRDLVFSPDGSRLFVSVGSSSNVSPGARKPDADALRAIEARDGLGAAWGSETDRAAVLVVDPQGGGKKHFANGLRNCVGMAIHPATGDLWCATNERDGLGDDLPPDIVTRVREGAFYGWPWTYIGAHEDPRLAGMRPDLAGKVTVPDVLIQPHSAPLGIAIATGSQFPEAYRGQPFVALHGSWNRAKRTGYKVVRIVTKDGVPTGAYEDFVTGFVIDDGHVWGRPVGVTFLKDGSMLISEDGNGTLWRVSWKDER